MRKTKCSTLGYALLLWLVSNYAPIHAQQRATLVIEGGTLIDGNGGSPMRGAVIVIDGNKISAVSNKGQTHYPANAQVLHADGKFIVPGLIEPESVYYWFMGEAYLANGVTSIIDIGEAGDLSGLHSQAVKYGKIGGPRTFVGVGNISARARQGGFMTPLSPGQSPKSAQEARDIVKRFVAAGADTLQFTDGGLPIEYYRAAVDEAHKLGKAAFLRPTGPLQYPKEAVLAGADVLSHAAGVDIAIAKDFEKWKANQHNLDTEAYSDMDDAKAAELIQLLVEHKVALSPSLVRKGRGFQKDQARFEEQDRKLFSDQNLRSYYPQGMIQSVLANYTPRDLEPAVKERRQKGYQNALRFYRMFVQAGGHVLPGSNAPGNCAPGLCLHQDLAIFAEAGLTPMQMIQSATKWSAEALRMQDRLGSIEVGKLADVVIVNKDPLQDIRNLQDIDSVIYDGKVQDRTFHSGYRTPFLGTNIPGQSQFIDRLDWVAMLKQATFTEGQLRPAAIESISPYVATEGDRSFALTIKGLNFSDKSVVSLNKSVVPSRLISETELQVTIDESLVRSAGRLDVLVRNPLSQADPIWGDGTSNMAHVLVNFRY